MSPFCVANDDETGKPLVSPCGAKRACECSDAGVAQLVEHVIGNDEVTSPILVNGSFNALKVPP